MDWIKFVPDSASNRKLLPPVKKYVLVQLENSDPTSINPCVVGYLKYHAGIKTEPYFIVPGASINYPRTEAKVIGWCDCLPDDFKWPFS